MAYLTGGSKVLVPTGVIRLEARLSPYQSYWTAFTFSNNVTAEYRVTGVWSATEPVQVIIAESLGVNYAGCGFLPLNYPSGAPAFGCWPAFQASPQGTFDFAFHVCVVPGYLPTGSFQVIFRSNASATVAVSQPFLVQPSEFPQSGCAVP